MARYLLESLKVIGVQESKREGVWKQEQKDRREYDPQTDRLYLVRERGHVMRTSCTRAPVNAFRREGEALLAEMGKALNQEAVAYETREGVTILTLGGEPCRRFTRRTTPSWRRRSTASCGSSGRTTASGTSAGRSRGEIENYHEG